jgi:hypothetical protein
VSVNVILFVIWIALGLPVAWALSWRWQRSHASWRTAVAEREAETSLGRGRPWWFPSARLTWWDLVAYFRRGPIASTLRADPDPEVEALRQESLALHKRLRARFYLFMAVWLGVALIILTVFRH